jgi:hypothetical protein
MMNLNGKFLIEFSLGQPLAKAINSASIGLISSTVDQAQ